MSLSLPAWTAHRATLFPFETTDLGAYHARAVRRRGQQKQREAGMFLKNHWYVAAADHEIGPRPFGRIILGQPVVFYRLEDGTSGG